MIVIAALPLILVIIITALIRNDPPLSNPIAWNFSLLIIQIWCIFLIGIVLGIAVDQHTTWQP